MEAKKTRDAELMNDAIEHYHEASNQFGSFHSDIPQAIRYYYTRGWIDVNEKLPTWEKEVLAIRENGEHVIVIMLEKVKNSVSDTVRWWGGRDGGSYGETYEDITHWMHIPKV